MTFRTLACAGFLHPCHVTISHGSRFNESSTRCRMSRLPSQQDGRAARATPSCSQCLLVSCTGSWPPTLVLARITGKSHAGPAGPSGTTANGTPASSGYSWTCIPLRPAHLSDQLSVDHLHAIRHRHRSYFHATACSDHNFVRTVFHSEKSRPCIQRSSRRQPLSVKIAFLEFKRCLAVQAATTP